MLLNDCKGGVSDFALFSFRARITGSVFVDSLSLRFIFASFPFRLFT
jgi:hypothetical protein